MASFKSLTGVKFSTETPEKFDKLNFSQLLETSTKSTREELGSAISCTCGHDLFGWLFGCFQRSTTLQARDEPWQLLPYILPIQ